MIVRSFSHSIIDWNTSQIWRLYPRIASDGVQSLLAPYKVSNPVIFLSVPNSMSIKIPQEMTDQSGRMKTRIASSAGPSVSVVQLTDPTAVKDGLEALEQDVLSLDERPFFAQRVVVRLEGCMLLFQKTNSRLRSVAKLDQNNISFLSIGPKAKGIIDGITMRPDTLITAEPGMAAELVVEAGYSSVTLLIPPEKLFDHLSTRGRSAEFHMPSGVEILKNSESTNGTFFELGKRIAQTAKREPNKFNDNESVRISAKVEIIESLLTALSRSSDFEPTPLDLKRKKSSQIIKTVVAYADNYIEDTLYISDLCRVAHVSERTLQYAFREVMDTTPMAYMKLLKLHRAREDLRAASRESTTVSTLATKWGFWHFGDFSRSYKKCFHESPSITLKTPLRAG